jgi:hypothetical protein
VPPSLDPGENTEPGTVLGVGVAAPELGRDVDMLVVDSNSLERLGFDRRYGISERDETPDARCLGRVMDASGSAGYLSGFGVASCGGVMRG